MTRFSLTDTNDLVNAIFCAPLMLKQVISVILAVTQTASWSALPLYLCVGKDGSVGIDLGRECCTSCGGPEEHDQQAQAVCGSCGDSGHHHAVAGGRAGSVHQVSGACGCLHYQILHQQGPVVARGNARGDSVTQADRPTMPACGVPPRDESIAFVGSQKRPTAVATAGVRPHPNAPIVLRC